MSTSYVPVKELHSAIQAALKSVGYGRADVEVTIATEVVLASPAPSDYTQGFTVLVDINSGRAETMRGSWGGQNMFTTTAVDHDDKPYQLPDHGAVIKGSRGGSTPVRARVHIPAAQAPKVLTDGSPRSGGLTEQDKVAMAIFNGLKSFARPEYLARNHIGQSVVDSLVERGYLKRNKAGSISITTAGKNVERVTYRY